MSNENNETIADIVREVKEVAHNVSVANDETISQWRPAAYLYTLADRIEAAVKREETCEKSSQVGNAAAIHEGKWMNGRRFEYEYAYCSECGHMQFAGWDTHKQAEENIESFACDYKFCPCCGAKMNGGVYVK